MAKTAYYMKFLYGLRKIELSEPYIIMLDDNISPKLCEYLSALDMCSFVDGSYHTFFGETKTVIDVFVNYWMDMMNDVDKIVDRYTNIISKDELLNIVEKTISMQQIKQVNFAKEALPVKTQSDQELYEEVERKYNAILENLIQMKDKVEKFDKKSSVEECMKESAQLFIKKINECFQFTHTCISCELVNNVYKIRVSLEDILGRVRTNLRQLEDKRDKDITDLHNQLYDKNKEHLHITRQARFCSVEKAEVMKCIEKLRNSIENPVLNMPIICLAKEVQYWETRFTEFVEIEDIIIRIKKAQENVKDLENEYINLRNAALADTTYFHTIGENIKRSTEYLDEKSIQASKALFTFFGIRGCSRIFYKNQIGKFIMDEYGHQVYFTEYGKKQYHITCDGIFNEVQYTDKYYFDVAGRYIMGESGEKVYQLAPCTSTYKLGDDTVLQKTTIDCGHSNKANQNCKMELKDPTVVEILPSLDPMNIKDTLKPEIVKYLWECFGHVVPEALRDVGVLASKNPIHTLAHRIISQKYFGSHTVIMAVVTLPKYRELKYTKTRYGLNTTELKKKAKESEEYRTEILKNRKDKRNVKSKAWQSKQVKRRKPEESDDSQDWATYNQYHSRNQFISFFDDC